MAAPVLAKLRRPCWPDGRFVRRSIDRTAMTLWLCAIAARVAVVPMAIIKGFVYALIAFAADQPLTTASNLRLHSVTKRREAVEEIDRPAPNRLQQWWHRYSAWEVVRGEAKADRLTERATDASDDFKAWDLRRRADRLRRWSAMIRAGIPDKQ